MKRSYKIKKYWTDDEIVGGTRAGQFASTGKKVKRVTRPRQFNYKRLAKCLGALIFVSWFLSTIQISSKPFNKAEVIEVVKAEAPREVREVVARDRVETPQEVIRRVFGADARVMTAICESEGSWNAEAMNTTLNKDGSWDIGICQINLKWNWDKIPGETKDEKVQNLKDPKTNIEVAKKVFDSQGFWAWSDYKNGKYKNHLK